MNENTEHHFERVQNGHHCSNVHSNETFWFHCAMSCLSVTWPASVSWDCFNHSEISLLLTFETRTLTIHAELWRDKGLKGNVGRDRLGSVEQHNHQEEAGCPHTEIMHLFLRCVWWLMWVLCSAMGTGRRGRVARDWFLMESACHKADTIHNTSLLLLGRPAKRLLFTREGSSKRLVSFVSCVTCDDTKKQRPALYFRGSYGTAVFFWGFVRGHHWVQTAVTRMG